MDHANQDASEHGGDREDPRQAAARRRNENLARMKRVVAVMSGKGGVGKSTVAAALALSLARSGYKTGLLDVDFHGPSIPTLLGMKGMRPAGDGSRLEPIELESRLGVMSLGFLLDEGDDAVIWRGPMKIGVIDQLLGDVAWGDLEFLVIDCPPGTGDEPLSLAQVIGRAEVVLVGTPQEVAMADVRKSAAFCRKVGLRVRGLVETMGTVACPHCGKEAPLFRPRHGARPAALHVLAEVPFDPALHEACDEGRMAEFMAGGSQTAKRLANLATRVAAGAEPDQSGETRRTLEGASGMRYAIPTSEGVLAMHFGHVDQFTLVDVENGTVGRTQTVTPPPHAPGVLPAWLSENHVNVVIAGGMGSRAQGLFAQHGIQVVIGAPAQTPEALVQQHLAGTLKTGDNVCDH